MTSNEGERPAKRVKRNQAAQTDRLESLGYHRIPSKDLQAARPYFERVEIQDDISDEGLDDILSPPLFLVFKNKIKLSASAIRDLSNCDRLIHLAFRKDVEVADLETFIDLIENHPCLRTIEISGNIHAVNQLHQDVDSDDVDMLVKDERLATAEVYARLLKHDRLISLYLGNCPALADDEDDEDDEDDDEDDPIRKMISDLDKANNDCSTHKMSSLTIKGEHDHLIHWLPRAPTTTQSLKILFTGKKDDKRTPDWEDESIDNSGEHSICQHITRFTNLRELRLDLNECTYLYNYELNFFGVFPHLEVF